MRRVAAELKPHSERDQGDHHKILMYYLFFDGNKRVGRSQGKANRSQPCIRGSGRRPADFNLGTLRLDDMTWGDTGTKYINPTPEWGGVVFCVISFAAESHFVAFCVFCIVGLL